MIWHVSSKSVNIYTYGDTAITGMDLATASIYLADTGVDRQHRIIRNTHSSFHRSWSHAPLPSFQRSKQFVLFNMAEYPFISSHPLPTLLEPECFFLRNSHWMQCEVRRSVDDGLSAFELHHLTTPCSSELRDALRGLDCANLEAVIVQVWRYTWRLWSSEFGDALVGRIRASLEMHLEAVIVRTWRLQSSECVDAVGGSNRASLETSWRLWSCELGGHNRARFGIPSEAVIERVWRCTWRPWSREFGDMHLEAMRVRTWRLWSSEIGGVLGGGQSGGRRHGIWDSIHWLTRNCGNVENWVQHGLPSDEKLAESGRQSILGWCSTPCMQYWVYAVQGVCCTRCMLYSVLTLDHGMER